MACDRFVYWNERKPTKEEIQLVLEDFFGPVAKVEWHEDQNRFYATIVGEKSPPFRRIKDAHPFVDTEVSERWIEVYVDDDNIDVMTRMQDELTNVLAAGVAKMFARYWEGRLES